MLSAATQVVRSLRARGGNQLRAQLIGAEGLRPDEFATADDPGWFGPSSPTWRVHGDSSALIGGLSALIVQTLHPLAMAGVADHSDYRNDPLGRLNRTGRFIGATTFGSTPTANAAVAAVRAIHDRVEGTAPDGRIYAANDPHLLGWVHCTEVDAFARAHERYGSARLRESEKDAYVAEMAKVGEALGAHDLPRSRQELAEALAHYRNECCLSDHAADTLPFIVRGPFPLVASPAYGVLIAAAVDLLAPWAREMAGFAPPSPLDPLVVRPAAVALARVMGWLIEAPTSDGAVLRPG